MGRFFLHITILFHQNNDKNIIYKHFSSFTVVYIIYFTQIVHIDVFFLSPEKLTFGFGKSIFSHSFWPTWLKQTSFCREFNCVYSKIAQTIIFHLFAEKNNTKPKPIASKRKIWSIFFLNRFFFILFFKNSKRLFCAAHQAFVNPKKKIIIMSVKLKNKLIFWIPKVF